MRTPILQPPTALIAALREDDCVLFAGPGLSALAGSPTMRTVLEHLLEFAVKRNLIDPQMGLLLRSALSQGDYESAAEALVSRTWREDAPPGEVADVLRDMFSTLERTRLPNTFGKLRRLPFSGVVTTNFDNLLSRAFDNRLSNGTYTHKDAEPLKVALARRQFFLLQLHGTITRPDTLLLSDSQFDERLSSDIPFREFLQTLCIARTHLFVGATVELIERYLAGISPRVISSRAHFALVKVSGKSWELKADSLQRRYNLQLLPYSDGASQKRISSLAGELAARLEISASAPRPLLVPKKSFEHITRITMENIGPFRRLELDLNKGWNVLLGSNGLGKSTLLRAIAIALCGEQSPKDIARLISVGQASGVISITSGNQEVVCELKRTSGRDADIRAFPPRPLEIYSRLAIAFPALRSTSRAQVAGPRPAELARPHVGDLLPIVQGDTDNRFDDTKQWLVNLDYRAKDSLSRGTRQPKELEVINQFFSVLGKLAKGVTLNFSGIDLSTNEVMVRTDDGVVSLDWVSQGTASLIGWVGYLLQRQSDVATDSTSIPREPALVLIDEVDAHMHPLWQRILVEQMKTLFPNVQFIVTSHSPLVVAGLQPEEVLVFRRGDEQISVKHPPLDTRGWRADQLLTSPLFGLDGTRDPDIDRQIERYTFLSTRQTLAADEQHELVSVANSLRLKLPSEQERAEARTASTLIEAATQERLRQMSADERNKILRELEIQIQDAITGSRRPS